MINKSDLAESTAVQFRILHICIYSIYIYLIHIIYMLVYYHILQMHVVYTVDRRYRKIKNTYINIRFQLISSEIMSNQSDLVYCTSPIHKSVPSSNQWVFFPTCSLRKKSDPSVPQLPQASPRSSRAPSFDCLPAASHSILRGVGIPLGNSHRKEE